MTVQVENGAVTLAGRLPHSVPADLALRLTRAVPGVVAATGELTNALRPSRVRPLSCRAAESAGRARPGPGTPR
ncbi:BON domain-containing protein [Streptomyces zaomyceticus]|uniref:BON domain-containing protein n=1 Tax=Streptomyces zaomyceticus TaxID=68286 RepID=UPI002E20CB2A